MLDLIVLNTASNCPGGQCPSQQAYKIIQQPAIVVTAPAVTGPTVIKYRRNLFGKLVPVEMTVKAEPVAASAGACKGSKCR